MKHLVRVLLLLALLCSSATAAWAEADFNIPAQLKPRVDFWIEIFTQRGKDQVVVHHRNFPQAVFARLDFRDEAERLGPVQLDLLKTRRVKEKIREIEQILLLFAQGHAPRDDFEQRVYRAMQLVPGGSSKYSLAVRDELVRSQTGIREKWVEAIKRASRHIHAMEAIFREQGLPTELTRLPFIESSFDYAAYSSVGAAGIWQFMRATAKKYMTVNDLVDERRDVIASTRAAARYLRSAYSTLGTWPLAITSYNHGVTGVLRKVRKFGSNNLAAIIESPGERLFGFASANFYPEFLAAVEVYRNHQYYFPEVRLEAPVNLSAVQVSHPMPVSYVSQELGISLDELREYNQALGEAIWKGRYRIPAGYALKVPAHYDSRLSALGRRSVGESLPPPQAPAYSSVYGGVTYKVRAGDSLSSIAKKYKTSVSKLTAMNGLRSQTVRVGQMLKVRESEGGSHPSSESKATQAKVSVSETRKDGKPVSGGQGTAKYKVKVGDSVWSIAKKFDTSVEQLKKINKLKRSTIRPGQMLIIP